MNHVRACDFKLPPACVRNTHTHTKSTLSSQDIANHPPQQHTTKTLKRTRERQSLFKEGEKFSVKRDRLSDSSPHATIAELTSWLASLDAVRQHIGEVVYLTA